jgi:CubicO group peptidase (beta-lactamase class C family)
MTTNPFPTSTPEELSVSSEAIRQVIRTIRETHHLDLHSFLMLRHGTLIWEEYFRKGEADRIHVLHSVSKSFTSFALGMAQTQGLLSITDKLYDFFPQCAASCDSDFKRQVTLADLLMMGSGFENHEDVIFTGPGADTAMIEQALAQPIIHQPGTTFNYYTLGTYLLSAAFSQVCPMGVHRYLRQHLFTPMGFGRSQWNTDDNDIPMGGFGLNLSTVDMARFGQLCLQGGVWQGQQLVPAAFVTQATSKQISNDDNGGPDWSSGYGFQFWRNSFGGYRADGMNGQYIIVLPKYDAVIVMTSHLNDMGVPLNAIASTLLPSMG